MTAPLPPLPKWLGECRRYMDDAPGIRAECERNKGDCYDCPNKRREEINALIKLAVRQAFMRAIVECDALSPFAEEQLLAVMEEYK